MAASWTLALLLAKSGPARQKKEWLRAFVVYCRLLSSAERAAYFPGQGPYD